MQISCIMANYNTDISYLKQSIESILNQSFTDFELIIVDDCSTDNSFEILKRYEERDTRIKIIRNKKNQGLAFSLNKALEYASGKYIARMDTDDIAMRNRFMEQYSFMERNRDIDICGTFVKTFGSTSEVIVTPFNTASDCKSQLLYAACLIHPSVMMRKDFLDANNLRYNEQFACSQDFEFWTRCIQFGNIYIIKKVLLLYRIHANQISIAKKEQQKNYAREICLKQLKNLNVDATKEELETHLIICRLNDFSASQFYQIKAWKNKLIMANEEKRFYDSKSLINVLNYRISNLIIQSNTNLFRKVRMILSLNGKKIGIYIYKACCTVIQKKYCSLLMKKMRNEMR